jgi:hypothetical protein
MTNWPRSPPKPPFPLICKAIRIATIDRKVHFPSRTKTNPHRERATAVLFSVALPQLQFSQFTSSQSLLCRLSSTAIVFSAQSNRRTSFSQTGCCNAAALTASPAEAFSWASHSPGVKLSDEIRFGHWRSRIAASSNATDRRKEED